MKKTSQHENETHSTETPQSHQTRYKFGKFKTISWKLHRARQHKAFIQKCQSEKIYPKFSKPSNSASKYFKQNEITKASSRILSKELEVQNEKIQALSFELTATYNNLLSMYPTITDLETSLNNLEEKFIRHNFPGPLVRNKIDEIVSRNFTKSKFRQEQNEKIQNLNYEQKHFIRLVEH